MDSLVWISGKISLSRSVIQCVCSGVEVVRAELCLSTENLRKAIEALQIMQNSRTGWKD